MDFIIDCCVLKDASGEGIPAETTSAVQFLNFVMRVGKHVIAVDKKGRIWSEVRKQTRCKFFCTEIPLDNADRRLVSTNRYKEDFPMLSGLD